MKVKVTYDVMLTRRIKGIPFSIQIQNNIEG